MISFRNQEWQRRAATVALIAGVAVFMASVCNNAVENSPTVDEPYHLTAGAAYLLDGSYIMNLEHPPLAKDLAALPLLFMNLTPPSVYLERTLSAHKASIAWLYENRSGPDSLMLAGRSPFIILGAVLLAVVAWGARWLYGPRAARLALVLAAGSIPIAAHTPVIHTDLLFSLLFLATLLAQLRFLERPSPGGMFAPSALLALGLAAKFTAVHLAAIVLLLALIDGLKRTRREPMREVVRRIGGTLMIVGIAFALVIALYAVQMRNDPPGMEEHLIRSYVRVEAWQAGLLKLHSLCPPAAHYFTGLAFVLQQNRFGRLCYFMGRLSLHGFPLYFPVAIAIKSQAAFLILLLTRLAVGWKRRDPFRLPLLAAAGYYLLAAIPTAFNIGIRHMLPLYPVLIVWCSGLLGERSGAGKRLGAIVCVLVAWYWGAFLLSFPHHLSYFNEFVGGSARGARYLLDSNVDWGQDLKRLGKWAGRRRSEPISVLSFGPAKVKHYLPWAEEVGPEWSPPDTGLFAGSVHLLTLGPEYYRLTGSERMAEVAGAIATMLKGKTPIATIGSSILVFELGSEDSGASRRTRGEGSKP